MEEEVDPGDTVTTDTEEDGATPEDPVETSLTSPNGGTVSITESTTDGDPPAGFEFLGQQVTIEAPDATAGDPLVIVIRIDASLIPVGEDESSIQVFKDGSQVADCTGAPGTADPDPCVSSRVLLSDGDVEITILTSTASVWNFGVIIGPTCNGLRATIVGTEEGEVIFGTHRNDVIVALGGKDIIFGLGGDDVICAGDGNDMAFGGRGNDTVFGEQGNDFIFGRRGNDQLNGGVGRDFLFGNHGDDDLDGGPDRDFCHGGPGADTAAACE